MPPSTPVPIAFWLPDPAPVATASGSTPNRRPARSSGSAAGAWAPPSASPRAAACPVELRLGELDDQDRVLGRQADRGEQAHLEVDVVREMRASAASSAPSTPSGTTSITANGTDQLSYSAARHRNTTSSEMA
jgi:hypothetical protein